MPLTIQHYIASATEKKTQDLIDAAQNVAGAKQTWKPLDQGRSAVDQIAECALINGASVQVLRDHAWDESGSEDFQEAHASLDTMDLAVARLRENTAALAAAIRAVPDADLDTTITLPWGESTVADFLLLAYWNMSYHEGQIIYIQTLS